MQIKSIDDVYPAIDEIIDAARAAGELHLATVLNHRMHRVAWTTRSELFEELQSVLTNSPGVEATAVPDEWKEQVNAVLSVIAEFTKSGRP